MSGLALVEVTASELHNCQVRYHSEVPQIPGSYGITEVKGGRTDQQIRKWKDTPSPFRFGIDLRDGPKTISYGKAQVCQFGDSLKRFGPASHYRLTSIFAVSKDRQAAVDKRPLIC